MLLQDAHMHVNIIGFPVAFNRFPLVFLWFSCLFRVVSDGFPIASYGFVYDFLWCSSGFPIVSLWFPLVLLWFSFGFLWDFRCCWFSSGPHIVFLCLSCGFRIIFLTVFFRVSRFSGFSGFGENSGDFGENAGDFGETTNSDVQGILEAV